MDTSRVLLYSPQDAFLGELAPADVFARTRIEEINGEHSLSITTSRVLAKETRVLTCDATGAWREYVVVGEDAEHAGGRRAIGTYYAVWSLQHDLTGVRCDGEGSQPGVRTPVSAAVALAAAIHGTSRWSVGTVTQTTTGGASMWRRSAWEALGILTKVWGGEIEPTITVGRSGVTSRAVNLYSRQGSASVTRRFDYSRDLTGIRRVVSEDPVYVRIVPLGKGEETEDGGVGRKIDISGVNGGVDYLEADAAIVQAFRLPDGSGGYEYPTCYAENTDCENPADLKAWGLSVIGDYATPKVSYEASVLQLAAAGMDVQGIGLGDAVDVVDTAFGGEGVRISGRVLRLVTDELDPSHVDVTLGNLKPGLPDVFGALDATVRRTREAVEAMAGGNLSTAEYLSRLIDRLNAEINSTGGYTYITQGQGLRTYDAAVSDPLVGSEATKVVELKGGSIRIADSKTAQGAWEWRTLLVSGLIASDVMSATNITTGIIQDAAGRNWWNLDTGELSMQIDVPVPAISIGAANLLDDTDAPSLTKVAAAYDRAWSGTAGATPTIVACDDPPIRGIDYMRRYAMATTGTSRTMLSFYGLSGATGALTLTEGETYTVSCYARSTTGSAQTVVIQTNSVGISPGKYNRHTVLVSSAEWKRISWTFTYASEDFGPAIRLYIGVQANGTSGTVEVCGEKLERGNVATDWAPSSRDIEVGAEQSASDAAAALDAELGQTEIFNRLTNNRQNQGIYISNGDLYVNASMIAAGTIAAARIASGSITADKIDAAQLISPKVGNSSTQYADIGSFVYLGDTYSGIEFYANKTGATDVATLILGVHDSGLHGGTSGTNVILGVGVEGGFYPIYFAANGGGVSGQPMAFFQAMPTKVNGTYVAPCIRVTTAGVYAEYGSNTKVICEF